MCFTEPLVERTSDSACSPHRAQIPAPIELKVQPSGSGSTLHRAQSPALIRIGVQRPLDTAGDNHTCLCSILVGRYSTIEEENAIDRRT